MEVLGQLETVIILIGNRTCDLPESSIVLPRASTLRKVKGDQHNQERERDVGKWWRRKGEKKTREKRGRRKTSRLCCSRNEGNRFEVGRDAIV
jgi:hypothetical protein